MLVKLVLKNKQLEIVYIISSNKLNNRNFFYFSIIILFLCNKN